MWLARSPHEAVIPTAQIIPLLNDVFAGTVTSFGDPGSVDVQAISLLEPYRVTIAFGDGSSPLGASFPIGGLGTFSADDFCPGVSVKFESSDSATVDYSCQQGA
jgi:hypothetical protein